MLENKMLLSMAKRIPAGIRRHILQEGLIDKAKNVFLENTPQEYLHDVWAEFLDPLNEHSDFSCAKCREYVQGMFRKMKPYFEQLETPDNGH